MWSIRRFDLKQLQSFGDLPPFQFGGTSYLANMKQSFTIPYTSPAAKFIPAQKKKFVPRPQIEFTTK